MGAGGSKQETATENLQDKIVEEKRDDIGPTLIEKDEETRDIRKINRLTSPFVHELNAEILLVFKEDPNETEDQMILFPHETTSKLDKFTENYNNLKKEKEELDELIMKKQTKAINDLKTRIGNTKKQIIDAVTKNDTINTSHLTQVKSINTNLENVRDKFKNLINDYNPRGPVDIDELKDLWKKDIKFSQSIRDISTIDSAPVKIEIKTITDDKKKPEIQTKTDDKKKPEIQTKTDDKKETATQTGGKKKESEFKKDPLDYIFQDKDLKQIAKLWNIKYSKNLLSTLKIAFKYKNNSKLNNKEWKQLVTSLNIKLNKNTLNKPEIVQIVRKKLINVPKI